MENYRKKLRELSDRLVDVQRPIRILDAIKWDDSVYSFLKRAKFRELPDLGSDYYQKKNPLTFDPQAKIEELQTLDADLVKELGAKDPLGSILRRNVNQYRLTVQMLES